jgi:WD40 repeat protein
MKVLQLVPDVNPLVVHESVHDQNQAGHVLRHQDTVGPLAFSPADGHSLASGSVSKTVRVWEAETGHIVGGPLHHDDEVSALALGPDGRLLASGTLDKELKLWQSSTWLAVNTLWHQARLSVVAFNLDGTLLLSFE